MEGIWDIFKKTAFWKFSNESTVQVNLVVHEYFYQEPQSSYNIYKLAKLIFDPSLFNFVMNYCGNRFLIDGLRISSASRRKL